MMINGQTIGLKGQLILTQGFGVSSVERQTECRPGLENGRYNRPRYNIF